MLIFQIGIIRSFKAKYRHKFLTKMINELDIEENSDKKFNYKFVSILDAINMVNESTKEISKKTALNCFVKCGFTALDIGINPIDIETQIEEDIDLIWTEIDSQLSNCYSSFEDYVDCDSSLVHLESLTDEDILNEFKQPEQIQISSDESDIEENEEESISRNDALKAFGKLKKYLIDSHALNSASVHLSEIEKLLTGHLIAELKQKKLTDFFNKPIAQSDATSLEKSLENQIEPTHNVI